MVHYWDYLRAAGAVLGTAGAWRFLALPVYRYVAVFSRRTDRRRYALEVLRLARKDAANLPSYVEDPRGIGPGTGAI